MADRPEAPAINVRDLEAQIIGALHTCYDPEIPVDIYELGLIYDVAVQPTGDVAVTMTLTSPNCPSAQVLPMEVKAKVESIPGVKEATVDVTFDPPWDRDRMSEAARLQLGLM